MVEFGGNKAKKRKEVLGLYNLQAELASDLLTVYYFPPVGSHHFAPLRVESVAAGDCQLLLRVHKNMKDKKRWPRQRQSLPGLRTTLNLAGLQFQLMTRDGAECTGNLGPT